MIPSKSSGACFSALALFAVPLSFAQDRRAEVLRPQVPVRIDLRTQRADRIVVKFVEGHRVRLDAKALLQSSTLDLRGVRALIGNRPVTRMFTRGVAELDREQVELEAESGWRLADLNNYYLVHTNGRLDSEALLDDLLADHAIETAYPDWAPQGIVPLVMPDIPPPTPLFENRQTYFNAAPSGFGHALTRAIDGAQGIAGQIVAQLEGAWTLGHEDAENLIAQNVIGTTNFGGYNNDTWIRHGTACFGLINANRNAYGTIGFAPLAMGKVSSLANGAANMISLVTAKAQAGDVFTSSFAYLLQGSYHAPVDYSQANFDAVKRAAAKGICYTFGAGNTGQNLANTAIYGNRYIATAPESGGFIIGATNPGAGSKVSWSNYGPKVIANGWGSGVATLGYGALFKAGTDRRQDYTAGFGGTSAAGPEVAGVIASLQGANMHQNGKPLTVAAVRAALQSTGTPISGGVGKRPDLVALMKLTQALDGLQVTREPSVAGRMDLELSGASGRVFALLLAAGRASTDLGLNRNLLLQIATLLPVASGVFGGAGKQVLSFTVPPDAGLKGKSIFFQNLDLSTQDVHLSNSVEGYIR